MSRYTYTLVLVLFLVPSFIGAQQLQQYSQFFMNGYAINPGMAGMQEDIEIRSNNRYQWEGITDAPRTYTLSLNVPMPGNSIGLGAYLFTDVVGPTRRVGFQAGGAYHLPVSDKLKIGIGFSAGILEYTIDGEKINLESNDDPALMNLLGRTRVVDAKVGVLVQGEKFYGGISIPQVAQNNLEVFREGISDASTLASHYYLMGGYKYTLNDDFDIEPNLMFKYVDPAPIKMDFSIRGIWRDQIWLGASYRNEDAFVAMFGLKLYDKILIAYSHDFSTSEIQNYTTGTHEVMFGLDIPKPE